MKTHLLASILCASLAGCVFTTSSQLPGTIISVETKVPGASPETMDNSVVKPMESALTMLDGVEEVRFTTSEGRSYFEVYFETKEQGKHLRLVQGAVEAVQPSLPPLASGSVVASRESAILK